MKTFIDKVYEGYSEKNRVLGNCVTIIESNMSHYYEFEVYGNRAEIISNSNEYIEQAISFFRSIKKYITVFSPKDKTFYKTFDEVFTFKLPISVIQPSKFFIDQSKLDLLEKYDPTDSVCIPVAIINEEYVILDGHTDLYYLYLNNQKLVDVYIEKYKSYIPDFVYLAKENNIFNISKCTVLNHEEYETHWNNFFSDFLTAYSES